MAKSVARSVIADAKRGSSVRSGSRKSGNLKSTTIKGRGNTKSFRGKASIGTTGRQYGSINSIPVGY